MPVSRHVLGIVVLLGVVLLWVGSSDLMQVIYKDASFNKPFFLTYVEASLFSLYLLGFALPSWRADPSLWQALGLLRKGEPLLSANAVNEDRTLLLGAETSDASAPPGQVPLSTLAVARIGAVLGILWFAANYLFNASLSMTTVSSTTIISSTSGLFTLGIGLALRIDTFDVGKLAAILLSIGGVTLVALSDRSDDGTESLRGDVMALVSAFGYGVYVCYLKVAIGHESRVRMPMVFAFAGLAVLLLLWPLFFLLSATRIERFEWPTASTAGFLLLNGLLGTVLSDLMWLWAMLLTTPVVATVGLSLSIPVAMLSDWLFHRKTDKVSKMYFCGAALVVVGFVLLSTADEIRARLCSNTAAATAAAAAAGAPTASVNEESDNNDDDDACGA